MFADHAVSIAEIEMLARSFLSILGGLGNPTGDIRASAFTFFGYLMVYLAERNPPREWPDRVKLDIPKFSLNSSVEDQ